jgi:hypothetical protein
MAAVVAAAERLSANDGRRVAIGSNLAIMSFCM